LPADPRSLARTALAPTPTSLGVIADAQCAALALSFTATARTAPAPMPISLGVAADVESSATALSPIS
jgi:hypothetical protein